MIVTDKWLENHGVKLINVYKFNELPEEAKEAAINQWREADQYEHFNGTELVGTLDAFVKAIDLFELHEYRYGGYDGRDGVDIEWYDDSIKDMQGARLWKYLQKHYVGPEDMIGYDGKPIFLTGTCFDYDILQPIVEFLSAKTINQEITFAELIQDCFDSWRKAAVNDLEYQNSDEYITETIEANEYEFYEDGTMAG